MVAVFTQPDRPKGRGQKDAVPPVEIEPLRLGLPGERIQPERVRRPEVVEQVRALNPEAMVVVGYGQIIPQTILDIPPLGIINVHASLLPKYRGAAPIQWAIARGETRTGVTTMKIDAGLDTGAMLLKWETEIGPEETAVELGNRMAVGGADLLVRTLAELPRTVPEPPDKRCKQPWAGGVKKGRRPDRLVDERAGNREPRAGVFTMAGMLRISAWAEISHLEGSRSGRKLTRWKAAGGGQKALRRIGSNLPGGSVG